MKKTLLILSVLLAGVSANAQTDVATARSSALNSTVNYTAVLTNGSELGAIRYMQDETAGIAAYGSPITGATRGDSVTVTGTLIEFAGLLEVSPVSSYVNHGPAVIQPTALQVPITSAGEPLEGQLLEFQNVTFVETGNFSTGNANYNITDGSNTLQVRVLGSTDIAGTPIPTGPISITGVLGQYNANYQLIPRDLNDIIPYVAPAFEINVLLEGATVLTGDDYFVGNTVTINGSIENLGSTDLTISGASFSGADAADFATSISAGNIAGGNTQAFTITYTPSHIGSHFAALEITSNDTDENPYIINLEGAGTDNLATEPSVNPSGLTFPNIKAYTLSGEYLDGTGASQYIVLWKNGSPITGVPADGSSYKRGDVVGDARVAYVGSGTSFTPRGIIANQDYYFAVYGFNGQGGFENYLEANPLIGNASSTGENIGSYYNGISAANPTLHTDLETLINPHSTITYFLYKNTMMNEFEVKDTTNGQSYVTCAYSGERKVFDDPFDWTATGYSREHSFPHSWMHTWPADSPEQPEYNDQHNLYPTNLAEANSPRSNLPLGNIDGQVLDSYLEGATGYMGSQLVYEPRDSHKGNAARAIFYMVTAYGFNFNGMVPSQDQDQGVLKDWHFNDLPDNYEIARHEYIYDLQGNRNPYIDSVDFACYVDFSQFSYLNCTASLEEIVQNSMVVYPVPAKDMVYVQVNGTKITSYEIVDLQGRVVVSSSKENLDVLEIDASSLLAGNYIVKVVTPEGKAQRKLIIE